MEGRPAYITHNPTSSLLEAKAHLSIVDDLFLYDDRLVIPRNKRIEMLDKVHTGYLAIT